VDGADSWTQRFSANIACHRDFRNQIVFDPTSFDKDLGYCKTAYWSRAATDGSFNAQPAIYRTNDGGYNWERLENTEIYGGAELAVHPVKGWLYAATGSSLRTYFEKPANADKAEPFKKYGTGFFISRDKGATFTKTFGETDKNFEDELTSLDLAYSEPDTVYISDFNEIYKSSDAGITFEKMETASPPPAPKPDAPGFTWIGYRGLRVSPANPKLMIIVTGMANYDWRVWRSEDGGDNWTESIFDSTLMFEPYNRKEYMVAWHPADPGVAFTFGGDWVTKSDDGGKAFRFNNNGYSGIMGEEISFNIYDPNLMFLSAHDYNGAFSYDGGVSWNYAEISNQDWGGQGRSGYVVSRDFAFAISNDNNAWTLCEARGEGGFKRRPELNTEGKGAYQSPNNPDILFAGVLRSADGGDTWEKMEGCRSVITHNWNPEAEKKELYAANGTQITVSYDDGVSWKSVADIKASVQSIAYNYKAQTLFAVGYANRLFKISLSGKDSLITEITGKVKLNQYGSMRVTSVANDPQAPDLVYIAGSMNVNMNDAAVQRSFDNGDTWEIITRNNRESAVTSGAQGGIEGWKVFVDPRTRYAYVLTNCYGVWKIAPPGVEEDFSPPLSVLSESGGVRVHWFDNGRLGLSDIVNRAFNSKYNLGKRAPVLTTVLYDVNGDDRVLDEKDVEAAAYWVNYDKNRPFTEYELLRSEDGVNFTCIFKSDRVNEYLDSDVKPGEKYFYKAVKTVDGAATKTVEAVVH
jgi:photosystem II stability/assembly factor-like uncharacterized protein